MPAYKDSKTGTWFVKFYCKDWTGENKQIKKRGFATKREALDYERNYKIRQENNLDMTFGEFWKLYTEDVKNRVKLNTWLTKEHIVKTKILPYFKNLKMNEITAGDVRKWQNEMVGFRYENGESYSQTYRKTMHNTLSAIFNHACRFYNLKSNPARQAGNMGKEENKEMLFWTTEEYKKFSDAIVDKPKAMQITGLSRHSFEKVVKEGLLIPHIDGKKKYYLMDEIQEFMTTERYKELCEGIVDSRNSLNDLTGKDWLPETKSFFYQKGLGADSPEAQIEKLHPAPYSFQDIGHLVRFFTKAGMRVLDPFGGVGSTAKACEVNGRVCTSIELSPKWHELSIKRLETEVGEGTSKNHRFINGDSCEELLKLEKETVDFVVTSPPYWGILNKLDQKVKKERVANNLETKYSDDEKDLGNVENYDEFLDILVNKVFLQCARVLRTKKYMALVVSDFRDKGDFISFHSDLIQRLNRSEVPGGGIIRLKGTKILLQNHKSLLPYGYPFAYVENIHHQFILIFQKEEK